VADLLVVAAWIGEAATRLGWLRPGRALAGGVEQRQAREKWWLQGEEREAMRREKGKERGIEGLTLNLLAFLLSVSIIYVRGVTIANGPGP
jgi:hypothetical protein